MALRSLPDGWTCMQLHLLDSLIRPMMTHKKEEALNQLRQESARDEQRYHQRRLLRGKPLALYAEEPKENQLKHFPNPSCRIEQLERRLLLTADFTLVAMSDTQYTVESFPAT